MEVCRMKKLIALLMTVCLVLGLASVALAAGPRITQQPQSATTDEKGTVTFQIKASEYKGLTWRFLNPATGEETTGKKLNTVFKKIKVAGPNGPKITLKNVPDEMHGWYVYCHLTGNGYEVDSDKVLLLVNGLPDPSAEPADSSEPETPDTPETEVEPVPEINLDTEPEAQPEPQPETESEPQMHVDENGNLVEGAAEVVKTITIRAKDAILYPIDVYNNLVEDEATTEISFEGTADLAVRAEGEVRYWMLNDMRLDPVENVSGFTLRNITDDLVITAVPANKTAQEVDENNLITVTCENCKFTWGKGGLKNVTSGQVPAGTEIMIICNPAPETGYSLNNGPYEDAGKASIRRTITEDTVITVK